MDWIEMIFGFSLDGGDGSAEALVVLACGVVLLATFTFRHATLRKRFRAMVGRKTSRS
jgi:hypothetical protein